MTENGYLLSAIFLSALLTFFLRAFPFVLIHFAKRYDKLFAFLGRVMPPAMMVILAVYAISTLNMSKISNTLVSIAAIITVIVCEHWRHQAVISIVCGVLVYVVGQSYLL